MAYFNHAYNPGSKPQILYATNCKSSTSDKLETFRNIFSIFDQKLFTFCFEGESHAGEITEAFRKI